MAPRYRATHYVTSSSAGTTLCGRSGVMHATRDESQVDCARCNQLLRAGALEPTRHGTTRITDEEE